MRPARGDYAYDRKEMITWAMARENPDLPGLPDEVREELKQERSADSLSAGGGSSADCQSAVSPTGSRPGATKGAARNCEESAGSGRTAGGLPTRDTADFQSALQADAATAPSHHDSQPITVWDGRTMKTHPVTGKDVPDYTACVPFGDSNPSQRGPRLQSRTVQVA
jgi:hypothetical protein